VGDFEQRIQGHLDGYRQGRWRASIMSELILEEMSRLGPAPTVLDIGCGAGFDDSPELQWRIATAAGRYIGIEPDEEIDCPSWMREIHRCAFEDAPIDPGSVQMAFAIMVLEHVATPDRFFRKLHSLLAPEGVFWGLTVDARHYFRHVSRLTERLRVKNWYLDRVCGRAREERYANYPTLYRANSPRQIERFTRAFRQRNFASLYRIGQLDYYLPRMVRPAASLVDRLIARLRLPGAILVCRLAK
jgi:SAM-dependent methyltransferase